MPVPAAFSVRFVTHKAEKQYKSAFCVYDLTYARQHIVYPKMNALTANQGGILDTEVFWSAENYCPKKRFDFFAPDFQQLSKTFNDFVKVVTNPSQKAQKHCCQVFGLMLIGGKCACKAK